MNIEELLEIAKPFGVKGINLSGCKAGQAKGFKGAMRRSGHAHHKPEWRGRKLKWYGWICIKSSKIEKLLTPSGRPSQLFWHEVAHIYRRSWSEKQCDNWAWKQVKNF